MPSNIYIIGAGAVGLYIAYLLKKGGFEPAIIVREGQVGKSQKKLTCTVIKEGHSEVVTLSLCGWSDLNEIEAESVVFNCVKAPHLDESLATLRPLLKEGTTIVLVQNGFGIVMQACSTLGSALPMVRMLLNVGIYKREPSKIEIFGSPKFSLSSLKEQDKSLDKISSLFRHLDPTITYPPNIAQAEWDKAVINLVVNPICTLIERENGVIASERVLRDLAIGIIDEVSEVAQKEGFDTLGWRSDKILDAIKAFGRNRCSSLQDYKKGRKTEFEYILGRFLRIAEGLGVNTPRLSCLNALLQVKLGGLY